MSTAIKVENLSKAYQLGEIGMGNLSQDLERWLARVRGKEDPFLKIGETNDRTTKGTSGVVWSLKDVDFTIKAGDAVGIIGRNGAGKSTLLKLLSRVTSPTSGNIKVKGRIASLLEVGTGFHPELTGRDNIFLNGAILGMRKKEITRKFDEIVDFSGVERYIDTPVKRYSSGMYVRLAFAVAAHLDSEILIVDEVLAVGDAEFQKKCLGKMGDVSTMEGRTVLFVSHNMSAVKNLCNSAVILKNGALSFQGEVNLGIKKYIESSAFLGKSYYQRPESKKGESFIRSIEVLNREGKINREFEFDEPVRLRFVTLVSAQHLTAKVGFKVIDHMEQCIFTSETDVKEFINRSEEFTLNVTIPGGVLVPNTYKLQFALHLPNVEILDLLPEVVQFEIIETGSGFGQYTNEDHGCVIVPCNWTKE